ncbi:MAG TPA: hypothetical protein VF190_10335, partial [Rhodothermales bacterium]
DDELEAREVEVERESDDDPTEEKIESGLVGIDTQAGTLTLELGNLVITYTGNTRFRTDDDSNVSRDAWEQQIMQLLESGDVFIEARRNAPPSPQAPGSETFTANDLRIEDDRDRPSLEVWVDADNFQQVDAPPPLAILRVFDLPIEITTDTRLRLLGNANGGATNVEFEGTVEEVSFENETLTLADGTIVQLQDATFDSDGDLLTIVAVAEAVGSSDPVRAEGRGSVVSSGPPRVIRATTIKVEVDD